MIFSGANIAVDKNLLYVRIVLTKGKLYSRVFSTLAGSHDQIVCSDDSLFKLVKLLHPWDNKGWIASGLLENINQRIHKVFLDPFLQFFVFCWLAIICF